MSKEVIKKMLQDGYNEIAYTDQYIMGYAYKGTVYFTITTRHTVDRVTCLEDMSYRNLGYGLRFKPNNEQRLMLMAENCKPLCSKKFLEAETKNSKYNRGEIFEKLITEYFGQEWEKDNIPFTQAGDIEIDGIAYQIKYEKATFTNEATLMNQKKAMLAK